MNRLIAMAGAVCVALLINDGASAQVPPNPDNPNDAIPDALTPA
jgi:glc operon protein GlcG